MSAADSQVVGAVVREDGKLQPVIGRDPSAQWTYRAKEDAFENGKPIRPA